MKSSPVNVFLLDDEFPIIEDFRKNGIYNGAINSENLYHLAINSEWNHLLDLQQLIKDVVTSQACKEGLINLVGFTSPLLAFPEIEKGLQPDVVIYDWEYFNSGLGPDSKNWLLEILNKTNAFVFVYSKRRDEILQFVNSKELNVFAPRFQLFLKSSKDHSLFTSEEFILQYILGCASNSGKIKLQGIEVEFTANDYLAKASDILYLDRIFGRNYILEEIKKVDFSINTASVEKIFNDSNEFLLFNEAKGILITTTYPLKDSLSPLTEIKFIDVVKKFSISKLEETLERGISFI